MKEAFNLILFFLAFLVIVLNIYGAFDFKNYHSIGGWILSLVLFIGMFVK